MLYKHITTGGCIVNPCISCKRVPELDHYDIVCIYKAACKTWLNAGNYCYRYSSRSSQAWGVIIPPFAAPPLHTKQLWQQADKGLHLSKHLFILHFINSFICLIYRFMDFKRSLNPLRDSSPCCASLRTSPPNSFTMRVFRPSLRTLKTRC